MTYTKDDVGNVPGKPPLSDAQKQAIADEWNAVLAAKPLKDWFAAMAVSDTTVSRFDEDVYDALDAATQARVPRITRDRVQAKKDLRAKRPT